MKDEKIKSIIESLLFVSGEAMSLKKISRLLDVPLTKIKVLIEEMDQEYKKNQRGLALISINQRWQLVSAPQNASYVQKMIKKSKEEKLSPAARETLAIIAYKGPLTRIQIDLIRGVNSSFILRNLLIRGLIEKKENQGKARAYLYQVSAEFLKELGLNKIEDLPRYKELGQNEKVEEILKDSNNSEK